MREFGLFIIASLAVACTQVAARDDPWRHPDGKHAYSLLIIDARGECWRVRGLGWEYTYADHMKREACAAIPLGPRDETHDLWRSPK